MLYNILFFLSLLVLFFLDYLSQLFTFIKRLFAHDCCVVSLRLLVTCISPSQNPPYPPIFGYTGLISFHPCSGKSINLYL